jgi:Protein of unknown function (DUF2971)
MASSVYRFRSTQALLDGFREMENQEIYFAAPSELNDPLEGFKDLFWKGDVIVWSNLLRHYLLCLMQAVLATLEHGPNYELTAETLPAAMIDEDLNPELRKVFDVLCARFFEDAELSHLPGFLAERSSPIRRNEFLSLLWPLHFRVLPLVLSTLSPEEPVHAIDASLRAQPKNPLRLRESFAALNQMDAKRADSADIVEVFASNVVSGITQTIFIQEYKGANQSHGKAWNVISSTFPEIYINALEKLLYYDSYIASFVAEPMHAAMWGHYGNGHRGVCLKFRTSELSNGKPALTLGRVVGTSGIKESSSQVYEFLPLELHDVIYRDRYDEIDFFRSLGRLTHRQLLFWSRAANGATSSIEVDLLQDSEEWRQAYWESFHSAITTKLKDWQQEREYRVALHSMISDLSDRASRKLRYRFEDLQAIIFGMKTSTEDKVAIVRLIHEKCNRAARKDFELYQTYYSRQTGKVAITPWDLVKLR